MDLDLVTPNSHFAGRPPLLMFAKLFDQSKGTPKGISNANKGAPSSARPTGGSRLKLESKIAKGTGGLKGKKAPGLKGMKENGHKGTQRKGEPKQQHRGPAKDQARPEGLKGKSAIDRLQAKMKGSHFRTLNEKLYTSQSQDAWDLFQQEPALFEAYHSGFREQVEKWPINPVDVFIKELSQQSKKLVVVDFGCGDAKIAQCVRQQVHSFDLAANNERVVACDMAHVPLESGVADMAIFCLSLMGTNYEDFVREASRVLKVGGKLKIAEVVSRFQDLAGFQSGLQQLGFKVQKKDTSNTHFFLLNALKVSEIGKQTINVLPSLKACQYKKR